MAHFIITSRSMQNILIAFEHNEWGMDRKGTPINIGDTAELRVKKNENNDDEGGRYVATILITSEPIIVAEPSFEWPDKPYPIRFGFKLVGIIPEGMQEQADDILRSLMRDHGFKGQFLWIGMQDMGNAVWSSLMQFINNLIKGG